MCASGQGSNVHSCQGHGPGQYSHNMSHCLVLLSLPRRPWHRWVRLRNLRGVALLLIASRYPSLTPLFDPRALHPFDAKISSLPTVYILRDRVEGPVWSCYRRLAHSQSITLVLEYSLQ